MLKARATCVCSRLEDKQGGRMAQNSVQQIVFALNRFPRKCYHREDVLQEGKIVSLSCTGRKVQVCTCKDA